jgi:hypothetical protein
MMVTFDEDSSTTNVNFAKLGSTAGNLFCGKREGGG